ncbi:hypothetical protein Cassandra_0350 [Pseudomonas phage Cassandra]|nr:hypothetical protein Cassandra_0350 [Pseudomonas phage Cassandra]WPK39542.1 hypothetical protein Deiofobo_0345 [Pseudomonas phage Deifobo]WPK40059.1 hypothetical protein ETTORE_0350 [Pseudomonas phage Ettore]
MPKHRFDSFKRQMSESNVFGQKGPLDGIFLRLLTSKRELILFAI